MSRSVFTIVLLVVLGTVHALSDTPSTSKSSKSANAETGVQLSIEARDQATVANDVRRAMDLKVTMTMRLASIHHLALSAAVKSTSWNVEPLLKLAQSKFKDRPNPRAIRLEAAEGLGRSRDVRSAVTLQNLLAEARLNDSARLGPDLVLALARLKASSALPTIIDYVQSAHLAAHEKVHVLMSLASFNDARLGDAVQTLMARSAHQPDVLKAGQITLDVFQGRYTAPDMSNQVSADQFAPTLFEKLKTLAKDLQVATCATVMTGLP